MKIPNDLTMKTRANKFKKRVLSSGMSGKNNKAVRVEEKFQVCCLSSQSPSLGRCHRKTGISAVLFHLNIYET